MPNPSISLISYQTNVLVPGPVSPHPTGASQMGPASRGIPTANRGGSTYQRTVTTTTQFSSAPQNGVAPVGQHQSAPFVPPSRGGSAPLPTAPAGGNSVGSRAPRRGRGVLKTGQEGGLHGRIPVCECCQREIRGAYILAMGKSWAPDHFTCANPQCHRKLQELGFVEENNQLYCEYCFEQYFAPTCSKCNKPVTGDCLNALERQWHPDCFVCCHCHKPFGNSSFFLEDGKAYCEVDWNGLFTTKCLGCQFPIEAGDRWVEALGNSYHSDCFTCTMCHKNLEGQSFYAKGGKPYCKAHA